MNFLSHFYFDRQNTNAYEVLGAVLPDLIKNANKTWNPHPEKNESLFADNPAHQAILKGWKKHLKVDNLFHNADFFKHHQHEIKLCLKKTLAGSPVKPFFLGHISLEILLDSLLITEGLIDVNTFYKHLNAVDTDELSSFLTLCKISDLEQFFKYFNIFKNEKYLFSYAQTDKITYALKRICMRIWDQPFSPEQEELLTKSLLAYKNNLSEEFIFIFEMIDGQLN
ncbi:hypothetical protein N9R54_02930 [Pelobium sp.]|nr:hypothetical protein [Pelobium sp.]MDA9555170.1 hypothetical protein [Pelobium sp.]